MTESIDQQLERLQQERDDRIAAVPRPPWWRLFARRRYKRTVKAMMATDLTRATLMLRAIYTTEHVEALAFRPHPVFAALRLDAPTATKDEP